MGEAGAYATHSDRFNDGDASVERMEPIPAHEKWLMREVNA